MAYGVNRRLALCPACGHPAMAHQGGGCYCGCASPRTAAPKQGGVRQTPRLSDSIGASTVVPAIGGGVDSPSESAPAYTVQEVRRTHPRAYEPWTEDEEATLRFLFVQGWTVARLAEALGRQRGGIQARLCRMGLVD
jgi:hypothetical protein